MSAAISSGAFLGTISRLRLGTTRIFNRFLVTKERTPGLGDPYATTIARRRPIKDLSIPEFQDNVECLKWTNWRMRRDVKRRILNSRFYHYRHNMKSIAYCKTLPNIMRDIAVAERNDTPRGSSLTQIVNRCALTSRPRGKLLQWRLSRIVWRDLADHGLMSGAIRSKWG